MSCLPRATPPRVALRLLAPACLLALAACSDVAASAPGSSTADLSTGASGDSDATSYTGGTGGTTTAGTTDAGTGTGAGTDSAGTGGADPPPDPGSTPGDATGGLTCDDVTPVQVSVTPPDANGMSSPAQVRDAVLAGLGLPTRPLRMDEFFNYYDFPYPAPTEALGVTTSLAQNPLTEGSFTLQIAVTAPELVETDRPAMHVTFVLDTSPSMQGDPLTRLQDAARAVAASLRAGDVVSLVTFDPAKVPILAGFEVSGPSDKTLVAKIDELTPTGEDDLSAGLEAGYSLASQAFVPESINRMVVISDGETPPTLADLELVAQNTQQYGDDGVLLVGVGVGDPTGYDGSQMQLLTGYGQGAALYVGDTAEANKWLRDRYLETFLVAARDLIVDLELPPGFEVQDLPEAQGDLNPELAHPQHLSANHTLVVHRQIETCAPELLDGTAQVTAHVFFNPGPNESPMQVSHSAGFDQMLSTTDPLLLKGKAIGAYVAALRAVQTSPDLDATKTDISLAQDAVAAAQAELPQDPDLAEIAQILDAL